MTLQKLIYLSPGNSSEMHPKCILLRVY